MNYMKKKTKSGPAIKAGVIIGSVTAIALIARHFLAKSKGADDALAQPSPPVNTLPVETGPGVTIPSAGGGGSPGQGGPTFGVMIRDVPLPAASVPTTEVKMTDPITITTIASPNIAEVNSFVPTATQRSIAPQSGALGVRGKPLAQRAVAKRIATTTDTFHGKKIAGSQALFKRIATNKRNDLLAANPGAKELQVLAKNKRVLATTTHGVRGNLLNQKAIARRTETVTFLHNGKLVRGSEALRLRLGGTLAT